MAKQVTYLQEVRTTLENEIAELTAKMRAAAQQGEGKSAPSEPEATRRTRGDRPELPPPESVLGNLDQRMVRLETIRDLIDQYPELERVIDSVIGKRISAAERRQRLTSALVSAMALIVGWLLSSFATPSALRALLPH